MSEGKTRVEALGRTEGEYRRRTVRWSSVTNYDRHHNRRYPDLSAGYREVYAALGCTTSIEPGDCDESE